MSNTAQEPSLRENLVQAGFISGMKAGDIMYRFAKGDAYKELFAAVRASQAVKKAVIGSGHARRCYYHKDDLELFCQGWTGKADNRN